MRAHKVISAVVVVSIIIASSTTGIIIARNGQNDVIQLPTLAETKQIDPNTVVEPEQSTEPKETTDNEVSDPSPQSAKKAATTSAPKPVQAAPQPSAEEIAAAKKKAECVDTYHYYLAQLGSSFMNEWRTMTNEQRAPYIEKWGNERTAASRYSKERSDQYKAFVSYSDCTQYIN